VTTYSDYKDLLVWQKAIEFANAVLDASENLSSSSRHYRLMEQLESAATSVAMNIAEGKGRYSPKEFVRFLLIARGSLFETMTLLLIYQSRGWISKEIFDNLEKQSNEIGRMLNALINSVRARIT
jgi:four helix bundle protein